MLDVSLRSAPTYWVKALRESKQLFSWCNTLSGAVLLGFGFLHILPGRCGLTIRFVFRLDTQQQLRCASCADAVEDFQTVHGDDVRGFPVVYSVALLGFLLVMLIEKAIITATMTRHAYHPAAPPKTEAAGATIDLSGPKPSTPDLTPRATSDGVQLVVVPSSSGLGREGGIDEASRADAHAFHTHDVPMLDEKNASPYLPYVLTVGLSFHSIFEGLAIGLQTTFSGTGSMGWRFWWLSCTQGCTCVQVSYCC